MTGLLVRSTATNWAKGSVLAVDAGIHLAAVTNIIKEHLPHAVPKEPADLSTGVTQSIISPRPSNGPANRTRTNTPQADAEKSQLVLSSGPLADFELPHTTAKANAAYFVRNLITTYLITHPHLDHISGFVINTAGFQHTSRPKRLAGLPSTIDAFKNHVFNDVLWPNLSDEDGGVGLVSYMRLAEGGNLAIGEGEGRGYIEVCDGLAVKSWSVSHGKCMHNHGRHSSGSGHTQEAFTESLSRRPSQNVNVGTPQGFQHPQNHGPCVIDSSAFFLRDDHTGNEILIFGDVEPDFLSLSPRTAQVWTDAAPKIAAGFLKGVFIECSYDESQSDDTLFGHLAPRHVIAELQVLAEKVRAHRNGNLEVLTPLGKRKRVSSGLSLDDLDPRNRRGRRASNPGRRKSRKSNVSPASIPAAEETGDVGEHTDGNKASIPDQLPTPGTARENSIAPPGGPLEGFQVIIIHVKDNLKDGPSISEIVLEQLQAMEKQAQLGCTFAVSAPGTSVWL